MRVYTAEHIFGRSLVMNSVRLIDNNNIIYNDNSNYNSSNSKTQFSPNVAPSTLLPAVVGAYLQTVSGRHHPAPMEQWRPTELEARCRDHHRRHPRPRMRHYLGASNNPIFVVDRTSTKYIRHNYRGPASHCDFRAKCNLYASVEMWLLFQRK